MRRVVDGDLRRISRRPRLTGLRRQSEGVPDAVGGVSPRVNGRGRPARLHHRPIGLIQIAPDSLWSAELESHRQAAAGGRLAMSAGPAGCAKNQTSPVTSETTAVRTYPGPCHPVHSNWRLGFERVQDRSSRCLALSWWSNASGGMPRRAEVPSSIPQGGLSPAPQPDRRPGEASLAPAAPRPCP